MMTVTTSVMILSFAYINNQKVVVFAGDDRRVPLWNLTSVYNAYAAVIIAVSMIFKGQQFGFGLIVAFASLQAGCAVCLILSRVLTDMKLPVWR